MTSLQRAGRLLILIAGPRLAMAQFADSSSIRSINRLAHVLAGNWQTVEIVQYGKPVPKGAGRRGSVHVWLAGGGTALVSEGHTVGSVGGDLRWFEIFWWEPDSSRYGLLTCFRAQTDASCALRGTAHWEGDVFVNDYDDLVDGKRVKMQDRWSDITHVSLTLTELRWTDSGWAPYVVSHDTRDH